VLPTGELRFTAAETVRRITLERARQLAEQHHVLLEQLAEDDGLVPDLSAATAHNVQ
jgi:hypothetical protein